MRIFQTHGSDGLWHERTEEQYNRAYEGAKRILYTDCAKFKYYQKVTGTFEGALALFNTNYDFICDTDSVFYEPIDVLQKPNDINDYLTKRMAQLQSRYDKDTTDPNHIWVRLTEVKEILRFLETGKSLYGEGDSFEIEHYEK